MRDRIAHLRQIVGDNSLVSIDTLIDLCDSDPDFWSARFRESATRNAKKAALRRIMRQVRDAAGFPVFSSIKTCDENGAPVRVYKAEGLFTAFDYESTADYHAERASYHQHMEEAYRRRGRQRYGDSVGRRYRAPVEVQDDHGRSRKRELWLSIDRAPYEFLVTSISQRYDQIRRDVVHLQNDVESINEFHRPKGLPRIQMNFDFTNLNNRY